MIATDPVIEVEAERLLRLLMNVECDPHGRSWNIRELCFWTPTYSR